ncbi:hypothetical protein AOLI_G00299630 [Acnodon oligacanthus]
MPCSWWQWVTSRRPSTNRGRGVRRPSVVSVIYLFVSRSARASLRSHASSPGTGRVSAGARACVNACPRASPVRLDGDESSARARKSSSISTTSSSSSIRSSIGGGSAQVSAFDPGRGDRARHRSRAGVSAGHHGRSEARDPSLSSAVLAVRSPGTLACDRARAPHPVNYASAARACEEGLSPCGPRLVRAEGRCTAG